MHRWTLLAAGAAVASVGGSAAPALASSAARATAEARASGHRVEVTAQAGELRKVFANPDGTFTAKLFSQPVQVRRGGQWVAVDTGLKVRPDGLIAPRAIAGSLTLSGGGQTAALARLAAGGQSVELGWPGELPRPTLKGDTATYAEVRPGVDLKVRATPTGFAPRFVVKRRAAAARVRRITLERRVAAAGRQLAIDVGDAAMWNASRHAKVTTRVGDESVTVVPDAAFMADPDTVYPLAIAVPDYQRPIWESGWAKVMSGNPNTTYWLGGGDGGEAKVGYCGWPGCNGIGTVRSYFQYDHQGFLFGKNIISAQLNARNYYSPSCSARWVDLWQTDPIGGATTWNNQPWGSRAFVGNANVAFGYSASCPANWLGFDLTTSIRHRVAQGWNLFTYALAAGGESDAYAWKKFDWNPSLVVHYNTPPSVDGEGAEGGDCAVQPNEPYTTDATPRLRARISDPDGGLVQAHFEWFVRFGGKVGEIVTGEQSSGSTFTVDVPAGAFGDGAKVAYRVRGFDGRDWSAFGRWCDITVDTTKPAGMPAVTSTDYPAGQQSGSPGQSGMFTFARSSDPGDADVTGFRYSLVNSPPSEFVSAPSGSITLALTPERTGPQRLFVQSVDKAGNLGPIRTYQFLVGLPTVPDGHWRLDGHHPDVSVPDASGNGRDGTMSGGAWTTGRIRDAVRLNGSSGQVATTGGPPVRTDGSFTVSAWVRLNSAPQGWRTAVSIDGARASGFYLQWNPNVGAWSMAMAHTDADDATADRANAAGAAPLDRWIHLAGVHDVGARQLRIYVDGALAGTAPHADAWNAAGALQIGRAKWNGGMVDHWHGDVDDVKIYQRALPAGEIGSLATRPTADEGRWMLDETAGTTAADASGHFRHATTTPGTSWASGPVGGAVQLDGATGSLGTDGPVLRTDTSFTISAWVKADRFENGIVRTAVSQDGGEKSAFLLSYRGDSGKWSLLMPGVDVGAGDHALVASSVVPQTNEWTHLTGVYDRAARQLRIYVNGAESGTAPLPDGWSPWQASGPLRIGRAKWAGREVDHWAGAIDDVQVFAGVRSAAEILDTYLNPPAAPTTANAGSIGRYVNHDGDHLTASGPVPHGYRFEGALGMPAPATAANTRMLYACRLGSDSFTSAQTDCEGHPRLAEVGLVYADAVPGVQTRALYRCRVTSTGERFESDDAACEGQSLDGLLGYVRTYVPLVGHVQADPPRDRRTSIGAVPATYEPRQRFGVIALAGGAGMRAIYACQDGSDAFSSPDAGCEGKQSRGRLGFVWIDPPPELEAVGLYACRDAETSERYDSSSEGCGGDTLERALGYLVTAL